MTLRKCWTQAHWLLGITAGTVLMLIGLSGAMLSFREELTDLLNPGGRHVTPQQVAALTPQQLLAALATQQPERAVGTLAVYARPGAAARVIYAPLAGERRGDTAYLDPYTGRLMSPLHGAEVFETAEELHRWLLLPREDGRVATGVLAIGLLLLSLTGLYLRWPRDALQWRAWWHVDPRLEGRALLRRLHLVLGTACLPLYVVLTCTGLFWAFDTVRNPVSAWLGEPRAEAKAGNAKAKPARDAAAPPSRPDLTTAWQAFQAATAPGGWREAIIRVPASAKAPVQFTWLDATPAHERARNRMTVLAASGTLQQDERHDAKPWGGKVLAAIYPLHMGSYLGLPGRIAMLFASLMLVFFGVTGWWLYLGRRRLAQQARHKRRAAGT